jgi:uncharacterized protein
MAERIKVVIDTNILVASLSSRSVHHWFIQALLNDRFDMVISHDVLLEYEEILKQKYGFSIASTFLDALNELPNVLLCDVFYQWRLLQDADDDKFVDVAVASSALCIVTEDNDFKPLKKIKFPPVNVLSLAGFKQLLTKNKK